MLDAEQLQAAYDKGWCGGYAKVEGESFSDARRRAHAAGLAAVARQQAEHDAQIAEQVYPLGALVLGDAPSKIAIAILAQFEKEGN